MEKNSLNKYWNIISIFLAVISMASLGESVLKWGDFITDIIAWYRNIFYLPFDLLPFEISNKFKDYIAIGMLFSSSILRAEKELSTEKVEWSNITFLIVYLFISALFWVLLVIILMLILLGKSAAKEEKEKEERVNIAKRTLEWLFITLITLILVYTFDRVMVAW